SEPTAPPAQETSAFTPTFTPAFTPTQRPPGLIRVTEPHAPSLTPTPSPTPTLVPTATEAACWQKPGRTEYGSLQSDLLRDLLEYTIHLPPCYDEYKSNRYPTLYLIHGQSYNQDQWQRLGAFETADRLAAEGEISPYIIVLPRDRVWSQPTEDMFGRVVAEDLVPLVDRYYRTLPEAPYRAVGGLSRGASWAIHLGLTRYDLFGAFGGHSPPVFHTDAIQMRTWLDELPPEQTPRIYLDIGDNDRPEILRSALWFEQLLTEKGIPHEWRMFSGYHEEAYWQKHLEDYLRWYAEEW
ncbi:MAG TPA: alpha/beta hydrolase-fold protein, partial [Anaerolineales bacterium]|nr:alpha/beta hydrolase-fold protein [Anaerolineales bacterium]